MRIRLSSVTKLHLQMLQYAFLQRIPWNITIRTAQQQDIAPMRPEEGCDAVLLVLSPNCGAS